VAKKDEQTAEEAFNALLKKIAHAPPIPIDEPSDPQLIGQTIDHFRIESHIGSGGMGAVYLATDERLHRKVAVKVLPRDAVSPARRALLLREARSAAAVSHLNVAAVYEVGEHAGRPFIAMEYVNGPSLRSVLAHGPLPAREAYAYALQIARGLSRAHRTGIVHRDLKPDNVMLDRERTIKILDFGLARSLADAQAIERGSDGALRAADEASEARRRLAASGDAAASLASRSSASGNTHTIGGTPAYMAPEQANGREADARADVFSFGATAFEMLTGRAGKPNEKLPRTTARAFARVVERCLHADPARRFADGDELERALRGAAPRRVDGWTVPAIAAAAALVAVVGLSTYLGRPGSEPTPPVKQLTFNSAEAPVAAAALSPDGARLAYVEARGVFVQEIATRSTRRIETTPRVDALVPSVSWLADGRRVLLSGTGEGGRRDLFTVDVASGAATPMQLGDWTSFATVAPDGKRVAVVEHKGVWEGSVEIVDLDGKGRRTIYDAHDEELITPPRWSPDGQRVAFVRGVRTKDYLVYALDIADVTTAARRTIVEDDRLVAATEESSFGWSPDDRMLIALAPTMAAPERGGLFAIDGVDFGEGTPRIDFTARHPLEGFAGLRINDIAFDGSGRRMAFVRSESQSDVFAGTLSADGHHLDNVERLTLSDGNERPSSWSQDSRDILIVSDVGHRHAVSALSLDARYAVPLAGADGPGTWPVLGPNGRGVLYWRLPADDVRNAPLDLMIVEPGTTARRVYTTPRDVLLPGRGRPPPRRWNVRCAQTSDACFVAHPTDGEKDETVLEALDVESGATKPIARFDGLWDFGFELSPDAKRIVLASPDRGSIDVYGLDGVRKRRFSAERAFFVSATWTRDGEGVIAVGKVEDIGWGSWEIVEFGFDGGVHHLWSTREGTLGNLTVSPDGRHLAFTMMPLHANVWLRGD